MNKKIELQEKKCYLFDLDGTIYLSEKLIPGAVELLAELKKQGKHYAFLTNNSSTCKKEYVKRFQRLGLEVTEKGILVSTDATIRYLIKENLKKIYLLATPGVEEEFEAAGIELIKERGQKADAVVLTFDTTITYEKLWYACDYLNQGLPFIASHPDFLCPIEGGFKPDVGSLFAFFKAATGREALVIGKPNHYMVEDAMERFQLEKPDIAIVGDRLYTDIRTGINSGITSIAVLSGETTEEMLQDSPDQPDYVFPSVKELWELIKK